MSTHPEDRRQTADEPTMPMGMHDQVDDDLVGAGGAPRAPIPAERPPPADPGRDPNAHGGEAWTPDAVPQPDARLDDDPRVRGARESTGRDGSADDSGSAMDDAVDRMSEPDNRAKLLMAIAAMAALTLLFSLVTMISILTDDGPEPVIVEGRPCLVEDDPDGQAVLYCQT